MNLWIGGAMRDLEQSRTISKPEARRRAYAARAAQPNKEAVSRRAIARLMRLPEYVSAQTVLWYVHCRSELRTQAALLTAMQGGKRIVVPYCTLDAAGEDKLGLWHLESTDELVVDTWKILEPAPDLRDVPGKRIEPEELDLALVPGVAFSRDGRRLGNGRGYYDRLLRQVRPDCHLVGICYQSQLFPDLPTEDHDVTMDFVVTEDHVFNGAG